MFLQGANDVDGDGDGAVMTVGEEELVACVVFKQGGGAGGGAAAARHLMRRRQVERAVPAGEGRTVTKEF
jgi:hypothetical protein